MQSLVAGLSESRSQTVSHSLSQSATVLSQSVSQSEFFVSQAVSALLFSPRRSTGGPGPRRLGPLSAVLGAARLRVLRSAGGSPHAPVGCRRSR